MPDRPATNGGNAELAPAREASLELRLEHVGIGIPEAVYESTVNFYESVLGIDRVVAGQGPRVRFALMGTAGGTMIALNEKRECAPLDQPHHIAFIVASDLWDAALDRLRSSGVDIWEEGAAYNGAKFANFRDPAGNYVQIICRVNAL